VGFEEKLDETMDMIYEERTQQLQKKPVPFTLEDQECSICYEAFSNSPTHHAIKTGCNHFFGEECLRHWLFQSENNSCPVCRARVLDIGLDDTEGVVIEDVVFDRWCKTESWQPDETTIRMWGPLEETQEWVKALIRIYQALGNSDHQALGNPDYIVAWNKIFYRRLAYTIIYILWSKLTSHVTPSIGRFFDAEDEISDLEDENDERAVLVKKCLGQFQSYGPNLDLATLKCLTFCIGRYYDKLDTDLGTRVPQAEQ